MGTVFNVSEVVTYDEEPRTTEREVLQAYLSTRSLE
jgi:hypothetical protein